MAKLEYTENYCPQTRGTNENEYQIYYNELIQGITVRYDNRVCNFQFKKLSANRCTIAFGIGDNTWLDFNNDELYEMIDYLLAQKFIQDIMEEINNGSYKNT